MERGFHRHPEAAAGRGFHRLPVAEARLGCPGSRRRCAPRDAPPGAGPVRPEDAGARDRTVRQSRLDAVRCARRQAVCRPSCRVVPAADPPGFPVRVAHRGRHRAALRPVRSAGRCPGFAAAVRSAVFPPARAFASIRASGRPPIGHSPLPVCPAQQRGWQPGPRPCRNPRSSRAEWGAEAASRCRRGTSSRHCPPAIRQRHCSRRGPCARCGERSLRARWATRN